MTENERIAEALKVMNKTAMFDVSAGRYLQAAEIFEQSRILEEKLGLMIQAAESRVNLANVHFLMEQYELALENLTAAAEIFRKEGRPSGVFRALQLTAEIRFRRREYEEAASLYNACVAMNLGEKQTATACFQAGVAYTKANRYSRAQACFDRAAAEFERAGDTTCLIDCLRQRASLLKSAGRKDFAIRDLRRVAMLEGRRRDVTRDYEELQA